MKRLVSVAGLVYGVAACGPVEQPAQPPASQVPASQVVVVPGRNGVRKLVRLVNGQPEGRTLLVRADGSIGAIYYLHQGELEGVQRRFYPYGTLKEWEQVHNGKTHGRSFAWHPDGTLAAITHRHNGVRTGRFWEFYPGPAYRLRAYAEFADVRGQERQNGYILYDTLGHIADRWGFAVVRAASDTIAPGDSLTLYLHVRYPKEPLVLAAVGDFDSTFRLRDTAGLRVAYGRAHRVTLRVPAVGRGPRLVRGYLSDYKRDPAERKPGVTGTLEREIHFYYPYFVR